MTVQADVSEAWLFRTPLPSKLTCNINIINIVINAYIADIIIHVFMPLFGEEDHG